MSTRCSNCGHVRIEADKWVSWQCPACLLPYETSRKIARQNESQLRTETVRTNHRRQRRRYLVLMLGLLTMQVAAATAGGLLVPQLWLAAIVGCLLIWLPIGLFGIRKPAVLWQPLWCIASGLAAGTTLGNFQLLDAAIGLALTAAFSAGMLIVWLYQGKTPKRSTKVHRHSGIAMASAFFVSVPLVFFAGVHPFAAVGATALTGLIAGWMQFRVYRAARFHAVREPLRLASATLFDWMTPKAWSSLWQSNAPAPDPARRNGINSYSGSENYGRRKNSGLDLDTDAAPGTGNAIDSRPLQFDDGPTLTRLAEQTGPGYRPKRHLRKVEPASTAAKSATRLKLVAGQSHGSDELSPLHHNKD